VAIPDKALELTLDPSNLTLDDLELFEDGGFSVKGFKAFMARYSNWTKTQVGALTVAELRDVAKQLGERLKEAAVPKENAPS